jgi:uncharacterized protein
MKYHAGELAVQAQAGVLKEARALGQRMGGVLQPTAQKFLESQQLAIASTVDPDGSVWASLLTGQPGFVEAIDEHTARITAPGTHLVFQHLERHKLIGLLIIDLATRRRLRINGVVSHLELQAILIHIDQAYFNCPKYIQARDIQAEMAQDLGSSPIHSFETLALSQHEWIEQADTFFMASMHPEGGADASHRGGYPRFVQVLDAHTLLFPDYAGNHMFNTLGNLLTNPKAGLLFIDFEKGQTLQLTGTAQILWEDERLSRFAGAERLIQFRIERGIETMNATSLRWYFRGYSPANPTFEQLYPSPIT